MTAKYQKRSTKFGGHAGTPHELGGEAVKPYEKTIERMRVLIKKGRFYWTAELVGKGAIHALLPRASGKTRVEVEANARRVLKSIHAKSGRRSRA